MTTKRVLAILAALAAAVAPALAPAQDGYPNKPIRIIVPFGPGSGSDTMARFYAERMGPLLGTSIIVDNRPGADGAIGMAAAKQAPADGYTIVQGSVSAAAVTAAVNPALPYDPVKDFKVIQSYGRNMAIIVTGVNSGLKSFEDMKKRPAGAPPLSMGTFSTTYNIAGAWLAKSAGLTFNSIPYKGGGQLATDVMGGQVDLGIMDIPSAVPLIKQGKMRGLLVTGEQRYHELKDLPTAIELGMPDYVLYSWNSLLVRDEVPEAIRLKLAAAQKQVNESPDTINNFFKPRGSDVRALTPEQMRAMQQQTIATFRKIAEAMPKPAN